MLINFPTFLPNENPCLNKDIYKDLLQDESNYPEFTVEHNEEATIADISSSYIL